MNKVRNYLMRFLRWALGYRRLFVSLCLVEIASNGKAYVPRTMLLTWSSKGTWFWRKRVERGSFVSHANAVIEKVYTNAQVISSLQTTDRYQKRMGVMTGPAFVPSSGVFPLTPLVSFYVEAGSTITFEVG